MLFFFQVVAYIIVLFFLPFFILLFFNAMLVRQLKTAIRSRATLSTSKSNQEENNITLVMIIIIAVFLLCQTPAAINQILYVLQGDTSLKDCSSYHIFSHLANILVTINSSVNFIIYCAFRRQFRRELRKIFRKQTLNDHTINRTLYSSVKASETTVCSSTPKRKNFRKVMTSNI